MMCSSDMQNKLDAVAYPAIKKAVRYASDISGISSLKEKQVEAITALLRERDVFVCLPTGYAMQLWIVFDSFWVYKTHLNDMALEARNAVTTSSLLIAEMIQ